MGKKGDQISVWSREEQERVNFLERIKRRYPWINFPSGYIRLIEIGTTNFDFWWIATDSDFILSYSQNLKKRYPDRNLVIFAKRADCDDIACWDEGKPGRIVVINDFADNGYENAGEHNDFQGWFKSVIDAMMEDWN